MNPWLFPWLGLNKGPLSGNVTQDINPVTSWLSPQLEINFAGNRQIESKVVADVASYGKQLGIISKAILELADGRSDAGVARLRALSDQVDQVKQQHRGTLEESLRSDLGQLKQLDPKAFKRLIDEYQK